MKYLLTEKGLNLLAKVNAGATLHLTKAKTGAGQSDEPFELQDVIDERQLIQISSTSYEDAKTIIQCVLSNIDLEIGYTLKQIGIFALDEFSEEEILFIIGQDDVGDPIPAIVTNEVENVYNIAIQTSNAPTVTIDFNRNDFIRRKDFEGALNGSIVDFQEVDARANITGRDTLKVILGKIRKFFTDLKEVAFSGSYNDLGNKPSLGTVASKAVANNLATTADGFVLDARQGKTLKDGVDEINSNLDTVTRSLKTIQEAIVMVTITPEITLYRYEYIRKIIFKNYNITNAYNAFTLPFSSDNPPSNCMFSIGINSANILCIGSIGYFEKTWRMWDITSNQNIVGVVTGSIEYSI